MDKKAEIKDKAQAYFDSGYNCCESVVLAVCDYLGTDREMPLKIATPFGSGMSRNGSNCGVLNAAFVCMGMMRGRSSNEDSRDASYLPADKLFNDFKAKYGSTYCSDITGVDLRNPEAVASNKERMHKVLCGPMVQEVTGWIIDLLE